MGVDVDQFLLASKDKIILKKSYRVPEVIHGMADTLIKRLKVREEKNGNHTNKKVLLHGIEMYWM